MTPDLFEENDSQLAASTVQKRAIIQGLTLEPNDPDFFDVQANLGDFIDVRITFPHDMGDLRLEVLDSLGTIIASSNTSSPTSNRESVVQATPSTGTYTIHVLGLSPVDSASYIMEIDVAP